MLPGGKRLHPLRGLSAGRGRAVILAANAQDGETSNEYGANEDDFRPDFSAPD
jgi:hypothetical protein